MRREPRPQGGGGTEARGAAFAATGGGRGAPGCGDGSSLIATAADSTMDWMHVEVGSRASRGAWEGSSSLHLERPH